MNRPGMTDFEGRRQKQQEHEDSLDAFADANPDLDPDSGNAKAAMSSRKSIAKERERIDREEKEAQIIVRV